MDDGCDSSNVQGWEWMIPLKLDLIDILRIGFIIDLFQEDY